MSDPAEQYRGSSEERASRVIDDAQNELARLRAQMELLMQERVTPALAGATDQVGRYAEGVRDAAEDQSEATATFGKLPGAFDDAMDELMGDFDMRLAEVNRRLDRVLERRR